VVAFIVASTVVFLVAGAAPVPLLIFAGAFNGLILPVGVAILLWVAWRRRDLLDGYAYPPGLVVAGTVAWLVTVYLGVESIGKLGALFR
jgi:Mn2+/Fe2+ NRAMP family transporter